MEQAQRKVVLGLGNILCRDEGLGVHAVKALEAQLGEHIGIEFTDGGVLGMNLLMLVEECSHLLILDAVNARKLPGTLIELRREDIPLYTGIRLSEHQVTFQEVLGFASIRGKLPEHLHLIGAQPADLSIGLELSTEIDDIMPEILTCSKRILKEWGLLTDTTTLRS